LALDEFGFAVGIIHDEHRRRFQGWLQQRTLRPSRTCIVVAKIDGRLLTNDDLQAFQLRRCAASTSAAPSGDFPGVSAPSHAFLYESRGSRSRLISLRWDNIDVAFVVTVVFFLLVDNMYSSQFRFCLCLCLSFLLFYTPCIPFPQPNSSSKNLRPLFRN
jgi:hypothetical protein